MYHTRQVSCKSVERSATDQTRRSQTYGNDCVLYHFEFTCGNRIVNGSIVLRPGPKRAGEKAFLKLRLYHPWTIRLFNLLKEADPLEFGKCEQQQYALPLFSTNQCCLIPQKKKPRIGGACMIIYFHGGKKLTCSLPFAFRAWSEWIPIWRLWCPSSHYEFSLRSCSPCRSCFPCRPSGCLFCPYISQPR